MKVKSIAQKLVLLMGTLVFMVLVMEVGIRLLTDTVPPIKVRDARVGQRYIYSFEDDVYVSEAGRKIHMRFNQVGFRGPDRPFEKPEGVRRVAVLGDSMIASLAVDEEDTLVSRLEQMLNDSGNDTKWEVMNFGVSGASPAQEIALYREVVSRFDPDIVLCAYFVGNDLADNYKPLGDSNPRIYFDYDEEGNYRQLPLSQAQVGLSSYLNRYSRFYVWQKKAVRTARVRARKATGRLRVGDWIYCKKESAELETAWKMSAEALRTLQRDVTSRGGEFSVIMIPGPAQVYDEAFQNVVDTRPDLEEHLDPDYPDQRLGAICREEGIPFLSMREDFRKAAPSASRKVKEEWLFHRGIGHFNEQGNLLAARLIHQFLTNGDQHIAAR